MNKFIVIISEFLFLANSWMKCGMEQRKIYFGRKEKLAEAMVGSEFEWAHKEIGPIIEFCRIQNS